MEHAPRFLTIRQTAERGVLTEHALRVLAKDGALPAIRVGNRTLVNFDALLEQLNTLGRACEGDE